MQFGNNAFCRSERDPANSIATNASAAAVRRWGGHPALTAATAAAHNGGLLDSDGRSQQEPGNRDVP